jgi:type I restriction enzyme S subunit
MKSNYKPLGEYIQPVVGRNNDLGDLPLVGLSIQKKFIPSIANTIGTDMSTYRIIEKNQFAYGPVTSRNGDKITIALFNDYEKALISQAYIPFEVKDTNELNPEYLMMWFRRPEFDRYARFKSHGSAREIFGWDEMCNTELPIPSIEKQREIVKEYNVIQNRIALNQQLIQKLEETAQAIYREWFVEGIDLENLPEGWRVGIVDDLCEYSNKRVSINELSLDNYISTENMIQNRGGIVQSNNLPATGSVTNFEIGNILISNIRPYFKKIWLAIFNGGCSNDVLCFTPRKRVPPLYLYQILEKDNFFEYVMAGSKGTKMPRGDKKWIMNYPTVIPSNELLEKFSKTTQVLQKDIQIKKLENQKLTELKELLLSKLATVEIEKEVV